MEKQYYLTIPFEDFKAQLQQKIFQAKDLYDRAINTAEELEEFKQEINTWTGDSLAILNGSFNEPNNEYAEDFRHANGNIYNLSGVQKRLKQLTDNQKEILIDKQRNLWGAIRLIEVSDAIARRDKTDLTARANYTTEDKLNLLLDRLYQLYDDSYYPVRTILEGNGIILKRYDDDRELTGVLENNGYVEQLGTQGGVNARLTAQGAMYVEEKRKTYKENYDDINKSQEEINTRVDEVLERLTKLGYGQEIIFDEIQELKELYSKVSKKTWGQVVKGKLIDLSLAKLIEKDTLDFIYHALTNHNLRLP